MHLSSSFSQGEHCHQSPCFDPGISCLLLADTEGVCPEADQGVSVSPQLKEEERLLIS
jgi:hypothetical protein